MYKTSKDTQKRKDIKRQIILETAAKVFAAKGYHNTSVKDIVDEASISVGSFYFYFKGKEELFTELYQSIAKEFQECGEKALDIENFTLAKNFTRVIISNLWMYECNRELAKIMLIEAVSINPDFQKIRNDTIKESCRIMEDWFKHFKAQYPVNIPDIRAAALIFEGSFYYLINDWLESDQSFMLTDMGYPLCIYNLQALLIPFQEEEIKIYIQEIIEELTENIYVPAKGGAYFE
jgi:Transcriptional regulator